MPWKDKRYYRRRLRKNPKCGFCETDYDKLFLHKGIQLCRECWTRYPRRNPIDDSIYDADTDILEPVKRPQTYDDSIYDADTDILEPVKRPQTYEEYCDMETKATPIPPQVQQMLNYFTHKLDYSVLADVMADGYSSLKYMYNRNLRKAIGDPDIQEKLCNFLSAWSHAAEGYMIGHRRRLRRR